MPDLRLHQFPHSPFCLPVALALTALGVDFAPVNVSNGNRAAIIQLTGGAGLRSPVLEHGSRVVFESSADSQDVARYVDATFADGRLFPNRWAGLQGILIPHLERDVEGVTFRLTDIHHIPTITDPIERMMVIRHKERRFGRCCLDQWRAQRETLFAQATELLRPFDQMLAHTPFLLADEPVYSDFLLHGILSNLTWNRGNPFPPLPRLAEWHTRLGAFRYG